MLVIRELHSPDEFEQVVDLEIAIWQMPPREAVPSSMLHAIAHAGGLVAGAYENDRMVGMAMCFGAQRGDGPCVWSHMAGILPSHQRQDIGFQLKRFQRDWAVARGYREMRWTYDPLQRGNANFNLHRLGAISNTYHVNFYGFMNDALNRDMPSDRLEVVWSFSDADVKFPRAVTSDLPQLLSVTGNWLPHYDQAVERSQSPALLIALPASFQGQSHELKLKWRTELRRALQWAFAHGYTATNFISLKNDTGAYVVTMLPRS